MKRAVAVLVVLAAGTAWPAFASPVASVCGSGRTLAQDGSARVYSSGQTVYGCANSTGTPYNLGSARFCNLTPCPDHFAFAGTIVAYGLNRFGIDTGTTTVVVRRLTDGHILHQDAATSHGLVEGVMSAASVVVKRDGSDAWIGTDRSIIGHGSLAEVHRHDQRGAAVLESSASLDLSSLRLHGSQLTWRDGGATRRSTLR